MTADNLNEWWDQYNLAGDIVGQQQRRDPVPSGLYHLVVNAFIFDNEGHVLLQQRPVDKLSHPGTWDCSVGGSVLQGETAKAGIYREAQEELGLNVSLMKDIQIAKFRGQSWLEDWFAFVGEFTIADVKRQESEVAKVELMSIDTAQQRLQKFGIESVAQQFEKGLLQKNNLLRN